MKKIAYVLFCAILFSTCLAEECESTCCAKGSLVPCYTYLGLRHIEGGGIGYNHGYTTVEGLIFPMKNHDRFAPFIDVRGHVFNDNEYAANGGIGFRYYAARPCVAFGANAYFDYRSNHEREFHFTQAGFGIEILGRCADFRANAYIPINDTRRISSCRVDFDGGEFLSREENKIAMPGFDAEVGYMLKKCRCFELYAAIGPYYYKRRCSEVFGGRGRVSLAFNRYFSIEGIITHDDVFHTRVQGLVKFTFPLGCDCCEGNRAMYQSVVRDEIIVLDRICKFKWNY